MPSGGVIVGILVVAGVLYVGDKVFHSKPIQKTNHAVCRVVTLNHKCKPKHADKTKLTEPQ